MWFCILTIHLQKMLSSDSEPMKDATIERCKLRVPWYPPRLLFGKAWLACVVKDEFVFDAEKILLAVEEMLDCNDRGHPFFLDMKQNLHLIWPVPEFEVRDSDYPDKVGAIYPEIHRKRRSDEFQSKSLSITLLERRTHYILCATQKEECTTPGIVFCVRSSSLCTCTSRTLA